LTVSARPAYTALQGVAPQTGERKKVRILGTRFVRGWRRDEQDQTYDVAAWSDEPLWQDRIRAPRGGTVGVERRVRVSRKVAMAQRYREQYAAQAEVRLAAKNRVYAWRARKRAEREALRQLAREAHAAAAVVVDGILGSVTAYVQGAA
jgi:hypothetical protein